MGDNKQARSGKGSPDKPKRCLGTGLHLAAEVESLLADTCQAILSRKEAKPILLILFGSEARGEATPESDIDLLVVLEDESQEAIRAIRDAVYDVMWEHNFSRLISVITISQREFDELERKGFSFIRNIRREGVALWQAA